MDHEDLLADIKKKAQRIFQIVGHDGTDNTQQPQATKRIKRQNNKENKSLLEAP